MCRRASSVGDRNNGSLANISHYIARSKSSLLGVGGARCRWCLLDIIYLSVIGARVAMWHHLHCCYWCSGGHVTSCTQLLLVLWWSRDIMYLLLLVLWWSRDIMYLLLLVLWWSRDIMYSTDWCSGGQVTSQWLKCSDYSLVSLPHDIYAKMKDKSYTCWEMYFFINLNCSYV